MIEATVVAPLRELDDDAQPGTAAILRIASWGSSRFVAGLLIVNALTEPQEFLWNTVSVPPGDQCRPGHLPESAATLLLASLFGACRRRPDVLLAVDREVPRGLFSQRLELAIPVGFVALADDAAVTSAAADVSYLDDRASKHDAADPLIRRFRELDLLGSVLHRCRLALDECRTATP